MGAGKVPRTIARDRLFPPIVLPLPGRHRMGTLMSITDRLAARILYLEGQLEAARNAQAHATSCNIELHRKLDAAGQRIKQLEASQRGRHAPETKPAGPKSFKC